MEQSCNVRRDGESTTEAPWDSVLGLLSSYTCTEVQARGNNYSVEVNRSRCEDPGECGAVLALATLWAVSDLVLLVCAVERLLSEHW